MASPMPLVPPTQMMVGDAEILEPRPERATLTAAEEGIVLRESSDFWSDIYLTGVSQSRSLKNRYHACRPPCAEPHHESPHTNIDRPPAARLHQRN